MENPLDIIFYFLFHEYDRTVEKIVQFIDWVISKSLLLMMNVILLLLIAYNEIGDA